MIRRNHRRRLDALWQQADRRTAAATLPLRPLRTAHDVIDLLHEQVEAVRHEPKANAIEKARAIAYLAGVARKAMEAGVLADRLEILERVLQQRATERR